MKISILPSILPTIGFQLSTRPLQARKTIFKSFPVINKLLFPVYVLTLFFVSTFILTAQTPILSNSLSGKVICGYQGWFNCYNDGSPVNQWRHWSAGNSKVPDKRPAKGSLTFEAYPDVAEYPEESLYSTGLAPLGNGQPSLLFSSYHEKVIDLHFSWMKQHEIDGVALQRFLGETKTNTYRRQRDSISVRVMRASEKYERVFYLMYDMSASDPSLFQNDFLHLEKDLKIFTSPNYVHENGKPVICLWGFGFTHRPNIPQKSLLIIHWLQSKGFYVIGGVPTSWRTESVDSHPGYMSVYHAFDMLSPWSVGRFRNESEANEFKAKYLEPDIAYCKARQLAYQPVVFPGFAWSNWNGGPQNQIPRDKGNFMWQQIRNIKSLGMNHLYVAMFDEYDEGTAICKLADSYFSIPTDQYFLTGSADGSYASSDFYLRLTGKAARLMKDEVSLTDKHLLSLLSGPMWFRTSFEAGYDALPAALSSNKAYTLSNEKAATGNYSLKLYGNALSEESLFEVNIPVSPSLQLGCQIYPQGPMNQLAFLKLVATDGDFFLAPLNSGQLKINEWNKVQFNTGNWGKDKTICRIDIICDKPSSSSPFIFFIDDLSVYEDKTCQKNNPIE